MNWTRKSSHTRNLTWRGRHRFEHCRRDNQVYFITARCRDKHPAFASDQAKHVFWDRFDHAAQRYEFFPWVVSLLDNHYHMLGYLRHGDALGPMMQRFHGSVAKLVNDLNDRRLAPFWIDGGHRNDFDGCIRDERQCRLAYRDTLIQAVRHGIVAHWRDYPHTRAPIDVERGVKRAMELGAFREGVPYKRYATRRGR